MIRAHGPRAPATSGNGVGLWYLLAVCWGLAGACGLTWLAARIAAALAGGRVTRFGARWIAGLLTWRISELWQRTTGPLVAVITLALTGAVTAVGIVAWRAVSRRRPDPGDPVAALAGNPGLAPLLPRQAIRTAIRLRSALAPAGHRRRVAATDIGLVLGELRLPSGRGPVLYASWEDTIVAFMAPRSAKTTALGVPSVLSAPGPVVATSIKADLWAATAELRGAVGRAWLFDPQKITGRPGRRQRDRELPGVSSLVIDCDA